MNRLSVALFAALLIAPCDAATAASPAAGDTYVYRVLNGYNHEVRGEITYRVDKVDADRVTVSVTTTTMALGMPYTEVYTKDGNWLRRPLVNHDQLVEYEFSPAYPAYVFPLDVGKSWSLRVTATNPGTGTRNSVRVDGEVRSSEHIQVPAGAFDTFKVMRNTYAGDWESFRRETNVTEIEWYAPAVGRPVRIDSNSGYIDTGQCSHESYACQPVPGDWKVFELMSYGRK
jgi:hypothetical protein